MSATILQLAGRRRPSHIRKDVFVAIRHADGDQGFDVNLIDNTYAARSRRIATTHSHSEAVDRALGIAEPARMRVWDSTCARRTAWIEHYPSPPQVVTVHFREGMYLLSVMPDVEGSVWGVSGETFNNPSEARAEARLLAALHKVQLVDYTLRIGGVA
jgi:hypothetical protein